MNPNIMGGKPVISGTRITVEHVLELLSGGWSERQILEQYPHLTQSAIRAVLQYATALTKDESIFPLSASKSAAGSYEIAR